MKKIKNIEWQQTDKQSQTSNIERHLGRVNNILFFEIYKFKDDDYVMTSKVPDKGERITIGSRLDLLKDKASDRFRDFIRPMIFDLKGTDIYVFLDIDGVVATGRSANMLWKDIVGNPPRHREEGFTEELKEKNLRHPMISMKYWPFDQEAVSNLHYFQRYFRERGNEVKYVISSSWRTGRKVDEINKLFMLKGLHLTEIIDKTGHKPKERGEQINKWRKDNRCKTKPFIVIDDECSYDIEQHIEDKYLIKTTFNTGFDFSRMNEAIHKIEDQL